MKNLGIVKWFSGYSNKLDKILDYGFVKFGKEDVFLHKKNIDESIINQIREDVILLFDIDRKKENKLTATNIKLFNMHSYFGLINGLNIEESIAIILRDLYTLESNFENYNKYLKHIPVKYTLESSILRKKIHYNTFLSQLAEKYAETNDPKLIYTLDSFLINELEENSYYKDEVTNRFRFTNKGNSQISILKYTSGMRILIKNSNVIYNYLENKSKYEYLIELYKENLNQNNKNIIEEIERIISETPDVYRSEYCEELKSLYRTSDLLYSRLKETDKIKFLFENYGEDNDLEYLLSKLEMINSSYIHKLEYKAELYPIIEKSNLIFERLNCICQVEYLSTHYSKIEDENYIKEKFRQIDISLVEINTLNILPQSVIEYDKIWNMLSEFLRIRYYLSKYKELKPKDLVEMEKYYDNLEDYERVELDEIITRDSNLTVRFPKLMLPERQVIFFFNKEIDWRAISWEAQIMAIFKLSKEDLEYGFLREYKKEIVNNKLVYAACKILFAKNITNKYKEFMDAHDLIQEYVVERAWDLDHKINLDVIIPRCEGQKSLVYGRYCDCKPWNRKIKMDDEINVVEEETIYCPYKRKEVSQVGYREVGGTPCAKLKPDIHKAWNEWSFKELIFKSGIMPVLDTRTMYYEYTNKVSGWVNRLNEIRERLRCSKCNKVCKPNYKYSKNLAKFNTTVITCIDAHSGENHDKNVYLNQCWNCQGIIDSRESKIKVEDYYLCIKCGAGPQYPKEYTVGSICPKCGSANMEISELYTNEYYKKSTHYECKDCNHIIDIRRRF